MRRYLEGLFFLLVIASESDAWVRAAGMDRGPQILKSAGAFSSGNGDPHLFALNLMMVCLTAVICVPKIRKLLAAMLHLRWFLSVYLFSVLTIAWSANKGNSFRYSVYLLLGLVQVIYLGVNYEGPEQIAMVGDVTSFFAVLSVFGQMLMKPPQEIVPGWAGIFPTKNYLGNVMALGILALFLRRERWTAFRIAKLSLCLTLLVLSQSFTAVAAVFAMVFVLMFLRLRRNGRMLALVAGLGCAFIFAVFVPNPTAVVLGTGGKDTTLTGRDVIWQFSMRFIARHPLTGWGYNSFWTSQDDAAMQMLGWNPGQAHNGFLELALEEGAIGVSLLMVLLVDGVRRALREMRLGDSSGTGTWLLLMTIYLLLHNVSEADFYQRPAWVCYAIAYISVAQYQWRAAWSAKYARREVVTFSTRLSGVAAAQAMVAQR